MKRRYRFLRRIGCGPVTAAFIALLNEAVNVPANEIRFVTVTFDMDDQP